MTYHMNLAKHPFALIKSGQKTVEMRLCKPERESISKGDTIVFHNNEDGQILSVLVLNIVKFPSFKELYQVYNKARLGYGLSEEAKPDDMLIYYQAEDILKYGVLAIEIQLL